VQQEGQGADAGGSARLLQWVLPDAPLTAAVANCAAAEAHCRIVPLGPLPTAAVCPCSHIGTCQKK
jgi:hypothetical protein